MPANMLGKVSLILATQQHECMEEHQRLPGLWPDMIPYGLHIADEQGPQRCCSVTSKKYGSIRFPCSALRVLVYMHFPASFNVQWEEELQAISPSCGVTNFLSRRWRMTPSLHSRVNYKSFLLFFSCFYSFSCCYSLLLMVRTNNKLH